MRHMHQVNRFACIHIRKVLKQQSMNEDITSTNLAQENTFSGIIEKAWIVERDTPSAPEQEAQHKMLHICRSTTVQSDGQSPEWPHLSAPKTGHAVSRTLARWLGKTQGDGSSCSQPSTIRV